MINQMQQSAQNDDQYQDNKDMHQNLYPRVHLQILQRLKRKKKLRQIEITFLEEVAKISLSLITYFQSTTYLLMKSLTHFIFNVHIMKFYILLFMKNNFL